MPPVPDKRSPNRDFLNQAFVLLLGLFLMVVLLVFFWTRQIHADLQAIATDRYARTLLVSRLHDAARERSMALFAMTVLEDPFARDEAYQHFIRLGADFVRHRQRLLAMPLDAEERRLLAEQGKISARTVPIQRRVADLVQEERFPEARRLLVSQAVPGQNRVLEKLQALQDWQLQKIATIRRMADTAQRRGQIWLIGLSLLALLIGLGISRRVTKRIARYENALYLEKELAEITLTAIGDAVITTDAEGRVTLLNPLAESLIGWPLGEARNRPVRQILRLGRRVAGRPLPHPADAVLEEGLPYQDQGDLILQDRLGIEHAVEMTATPIHAPTGELHGMVLILRDVTELRSLTDKLAYQARHDALTGLINRNEFETLVEEALSGVREQPQRQHALLYLDLDQLKLVNDTAGHAAGDELLKQVANRLAPRLRSGEHLARLGGDEFGILLLDVSQAEAGRRAGQFLQAISETRFGWGNNTFEISASIGLAPIHQHSGELAGLFSAADAACYLAKKRGRNRIEVYQEDDGDLSSYRGEMRWIQRLKQALETDRFVLHGQAIRALTETGADMCELLIRLPDEQGELIPPGAFLPAAERYNLMPQIDRWVVNQAIAHLQRAAGQGIELPILCINLSGQSIGDDRFITEIETTVLDAGIDRGKLCFEVTETCAIANLSAAVRFMTRLREQGCQFALDDFGSGLSSFAYLKNLPLDYLKIDGGFIRDVGHDPIDRAFVESIQRIARMMDLQTIAEFVENERILADIARIGVHYAQGRHLQAPCPLETIFANRRDAGTGVSAQPGNP